VNNKGILQSGESAGAQAQGGTNRPRRILVVDANRGIHESSAEVLIRHKTNLLPGNISMNRRHNQARNAAFECQL
jgi:predicted N-formylglutamate amidohydrolase